MFYTKEDFEKMSRFKIILVCIMSFLSGFMLLMAMGYGRNNEAKKEALKKKLKEAPKKKKGVALAGVAAGTTAICTVGHTGNDLHYRGYDILDVADHCEFEEIAHLLVHGTLHAQGWDHETSEADAEEMEAYEIAILAELGLRNPYR